LTLVNAIYLKANWATTFDAEQTTDQPFATPAGDVSAAMMHASADFGYAAGQGWQAVDLPYVFGGLSFTAALVEADAPLPSADEVFAALAGRPVQLSFPRFDIETSVELSRVLEAMGMPTAFSGAADFSGMTTAASLTIGAVVHQANITVDEEGTEAAAATAVVMVETAAPEPQEPIVLTFDRPFTFWLRDRGSGTVLFAGRVADPGSTRS
jgi:serpin B